MSDQKHWEMIYTHKGPDEVSWYQKQPTLSLDLIRQTGISKQGQIIDVGAGASTLVDFLLDDGFENITLLDISAAAFEQAKTRLESRASAVTWIVEDITQNTLPEAHYDVWHDRAVFHFLTESQDRQRYIESVERSLKPGGHIIVASFAPDGPTKCSGLDVMRYSPEGMHAVFGSSFQLVESYRESHETPFATQQQFVYCYCRKQG